MRMKRLGAFLAIIGGLALAENAHAIPIDSCQSLSTPGTYELTQDITCTTGIGLASNVTLDGQGHSVTFTGTSDLVKGFWFITSGNPYNIAENITVRNIRFVNYTYAFQAVLGNGSSGTYRNITLENIETSGTRGAYHRGSISFQAFYSQLFLDSYVPRRIENLTMRNISIMSPYGSLATGYLVNSLIDGITFYGGHSLGDSDARLMWWGLNSTIQNVRFVGESSAPSSRYLMSSQCGGGATRYPLGGVSGANDPICGGMTLRNISYVGPLPRYDFRLGGFYGYSFDDPGFALATLEDSDIRRYSIRESVTTPSGRVPSDLTFKRGGMGSIAIRRTFLTSFEGQELFSSSPTSDFVVENNRLRYPESGPLSGTARLTFEGLPLCWDAVEIRRNGEPCPPGICSEVERFGTRAVYDVSAGGDYSLFVLSHHPECGGKGPSCSSPWDFNRDGVTDINDLFAFLSAWFAHRNA